MLVNGSFMIVCLILSALTREYSSAKLYFFGKGAPLLPHAR